MRRLVNEVEKQMIKRNVQSFFTGSLEITKGNSKVLNILFGSIFGLIGFAAGLLWMIRFSMDTGNSRVNSYPAVILTFGGIAAGLGIAHAIQKSRAVKKGNQEFVNEEIQSINGGTIVGFDPSKKVFYYFEDDVVNFDGLPIIIDYPANEKDLSGVRIGERVLIVYHSDNSFQLMHANPDTIRLIPEYNPAFPLTQDSSYYKHVPHPNAINMNLIPTQATEAYKEARSKEHVTLHTKNVKKMVLILACIYTVLFSLIALIVHFAGDEDDQVGVYVCIGLAVFCDLLLVLILPLSKLGAKRLFKKFALEKQVIFCSISQGNSDFAAAGAYGVGNAFQKYINVYEWENGQFVEKCHILTRFNKDILKCKYGDIIYLAMNDKNRLIYISSDPCSLGQKN